MTSEIELIEIPLTGLPSTGDASLCETAQSACQATAEMYRKLGFQSPWIGYVARRGTTVVGLCAFKGPPQNQLVEIAYFTLPSYEGQGVATRMAQRLIAIAQTHDSSVQISARTLQEENASTRILKNLGFVCLGEIEDLDDGIVWDWHLPKTF